MARLVFLKMKQTLVLLVALLCGKIAEAVWCYRCYPSITNLNFCSDFYKNGRDMNYVDCPNDNWCAKFTGETSPVGVGKLTIRGCPSDALFVPLAPIAKSHNLRGCASAQTGLNLNIPFVPDIKLEGELCFCSGNYCNAAPNFQHSPANITLIVLASFLVIYISSEWTPF